VTGDATLAGILDVDLVDDFTPQAGDGFEILTAGVLSGEFVSLDLPSLSPQLDWQIDYGDSSVRLSVVAELFSADFDQDADVDGDDLARWQAGFGNPGSALTGDNDQDLDVDGADFLAWQRQLGSGLEPGLYAVPEPAILPLLLSSAGTLVVLNTSAGRRRRRFHHAIGHRLFDRARIRRPELAG
jgi:hypothetical protein